MDSSRRCVAGSAAVARSASPVTRVRRARPRVGERWSRCSSRGALELDRAELDAPAGELGGLPARVGTALVELTSESDQIGLARRSRSRCPAGEAVRSTTSSPGAAPHGARGRRASARRSPPARRARVAVPRGSLEAFLGARVARQYAADDPAQPVVPCWLGPVVGLRGSVCPVMASESCRWSVAESRRTDPKPSSSEQSAATATSLGPADDRPSGAEGSRTDTETDMEVWTPMVQSSLRHGSGRESRSARGSSSSVTWMRFPGSAPAIRRRPRHRRQRSRRGQLGSRLHVRDRSRARAVPAACRVAVLPSQASLGGAIVRVTRARRGARRPRLRALFRFSVALDCRGREVAGVYFFFACARGARVSARALGLPVDRSAVVVLFGFFPASA